MLVILIFVYCLTLKDDVEVREAREGFNSRYLNLRAEVSNRFMLNILFFYEPYDIISWVREMVQLK